MIRDGALFTYAVSITNGAGGAGTISVLFEPLAEARFEIVSIRLLNGEASSARTARGSIRDADDLEIVRLFNIALNAGKVAQLPTPGSNVAAAGNDSTGLANGDFEVAGEMDLFLQLQAVSVSENMDLMVVLRCAGIPPTITEVGNSTPTITITNEALA